MINTSVDKFSVFIPFDVIEKSGEDGKVEMKIKGVASTSQKDTDGEILEPDGFDVSKFVKGGFFNYNHLASKDPSMIIGEPTKAFVKSGELHVEGFLYDDSSMAKKVWETAKILKKGSKTRRFGFSIEGKATERDPLNEKRITKAEITGIAITPSPKNPGTSLEIVKGGIDQLDFSPDEGSEFLIDITDSNGIRTTVDKNFVIEKSDINEFLIDDENDLFEKGGKGEGSRGGKVIGHTRSGKPIYESYHHSDHKDFDEHDHDDASHQHGLLAQYSKKGSEQKARHETEARKHSMHRHHLRIPQGKDAPSLDDDIKRAEHEHVNRHALAEARQKALDAANEEALKKDPSLGKKSTSEYTLGHEKKKIKKAEGSGSASTAAEMEGVLQKESVEGGKNILEAQIKKKRKIEQDKKTFSKAETYEEIFSMFNCNVEDAQGLYSLIENIQKVLTPGMEKTSITKDAILKAHQILGLVKAEGAETVAQDDAKKAEDLKKAEEQKAIQTELENTLKKAEELKSKLAGGSTTAATTTSAAAASEPAKTIEKSESNDISKAFEEKFQALGTLISSKDEQLEIIKSENAELKKSIDEISNFNKALAQRLGMIANQPMDRKTVTTTSYLEKGGNGAATGANGEAGMTVLSLGNKQHRAALADVLFKAATANPEKIDNEFAKAVTTVELGSLGDTEVSSARLQQRLQSELKIKVVK